MEMKYAGFWLRLAAHVIDNIVILTMLMVAGSLMMPEITSFTLSDEKKLEEELRNRLGMLSFAIGAAYEILMTSSNKQATIGKMAMGLKVINPNGGKIDLLSATLRHFSKFLSALLLGIGYLMIAFHSKKQGLHDLIANTYVTRK